MIEHSKPCLGPEEAAAAERVLLSGFIACGRETLLLEREAARWARMGHAVAVSNGTMALAIALRALGAEAGSEVVIPDYGCPALWHACLLAGAAPVPADCDPRTLNPCPEDVSRRLTRRTRAVVLPNLFGLPCDPADYALPEGVRVVQDCAQAAGARLGRRFAGAAADACVLSFYATKLLTCGEGGMLLTDSRRWAEAARDLRSCDQKIPDKLRYNAKMSDIQAAIARAQLRKLPAFLKRRSALAAVYDRRLRGAGLGLPPRTPGRVYHRYVLRLPFAADRVLARLNAMGIPARKPVFRPLHLDVPCRGKFPGAREAHLRCLSLPLHPLLSDSDAEKAASALLGML
jgi:perosamine synthetase